MAIVPEGGTEPSTVSPMPIRRLSAALSLLVALAVSGCIRDVAGVAGPGTKVSGTTGSSGSSDIAGTYILRTVNGQPLPYVYTSGTDTYSLLDDSFTLTSTGSWSEVWHEQHTIAGVTSNKAYADGGTYTVNTSGIAFKSTMAGSSQSWQSTYSNGSLTMSGQATTGGGPAVTMVFAK